MAFRCSKFPSSPSAWNSWWALGPPWPVDWPYSAGKDPPTPYFTRSAHSTEHWPTFNIMPSTLNEPKPSMLSDYSTWQPYSISHPTLTVPNNGVHFQQLQLHPDNCTFSQFLAPNSVYIKLFFNSHDTQRCYRQHGHCYVDSTAIGIPGKEHNRRAKLKQLSKNTPISAELSLRCWHATNTITQFSTFHDSHRHVSRLRSGLDPRTPLHLPLATHPQLALHLPTLEIQSRRLAVQQTPSTFLPTPCQSLQTISTTATAATLHKPTHSSHLPQVTCTHSSTRSHKTHTHASFDAARHLRSGKYTDLEVYAVRRMATSLEEPGRSRAIHILNQALSYRDLTPPKSNLPLTIPFLAHTSFQADIQLWLAQLLNHHKHFAIPLHLPTCRVEAAHPTLRSRLHNHRRW